MHSLFCFSSTAWKLSYMRLVRALASAALAAIAFSGDASAGTPIAPSQAVLVSKITGDGSINNTDDLYQVMATDLGTLWDHNGKLMIAFGDTYGTGWVGYGAGGGDWRSNVLALSTDSTPSNGLSFSTMIQDVAGHAKELLSSQKNSQEVTVIPTAGITVGSRAYLHFMSIHSWDDPGEWTTNYSGFGYSDDAGQTWVKSTAVKWSSTSNFAHIAMVRTGGYVYLFGLPAGRFGDVKLARVREASLLTQRAYQYWNGSGWVLSESAAVPIVAGPVGELSVQYNSSYGRWIMSYLNEDRAQIVFRDANALTGPWTGEKVLASGSTWPGLYGGFIPPWFNTGSDLYFNMSQWGPYNVFFMRSSLAKSTLGENILSDPGFEDQPSGSVSAPWDFEGNAGIDRGLGYAHSGSDNAWLRSTTGWNCVKQAFAVAPNRTHTLTGWLRSSSNVSSGYFGVRTTGGTVVKETTYASLPGYTQLTVSFNPGSNTRIEAYAGFWAPGTDAWVQVDDLSVTAN